MQKDTGKSNAMSTECGRCARFYATAIIGIILCVFMSGCLYRGVRVIGLEQQAQQIEATHYRIVGDSEGKSSSFNLFWLIPVTPRVNYDRAVRDAISNKRGDSIIDIRTWIERQIWIVGMVEILHVRGTVIQYEK